MIGVKEPTGLVGARQRGLLRCVSSPFAAFAASLLPCGGGVRRVWVGVWPAWGWAPGWGAGPARAGGVCSGGVLLFRSLVGAVPLALGGLASGFGMGPGVSPPAVAAGTVVGLWCAALVAGPPWGGGVGWFWAA